MVNYAMIDNDDKIPFWTRVAEQVHIAGTEAFPNDPVQSAPCKFIMQLSHSGRQQDIGGVENRYRKALSSTNQKDYFHGILCQAMTKTEVRVTIQHFALAAGRAPKAGIDGVELHGANGYLITQFLSSAINDRKDEYGGDLRSRAKFLIDVIDAIKQKMGSSFHCQVKTIRNAIDPAIKVLVTGGYQHRGVIAEAIKQNKVDGVSIARPLVANRDLPKLFYAGMDWDHASWVPDNEWPIRSRLPCSYCNKCLANDLENPLGCYDQDRFQDYDSIIKQVMEVFHGLDE